MTDTLPTSRPRMKMTPLALRLGDLATEFEQAALYYASLESEHNRLLRAAALRSALQLWEVAERVSRGEFTEDHGAVWLKAGWRIINAIGRENVR